MSTKFCKLRKLWQKKAKKVILATIQVKKIVEIQKSKDSYRHFLMV